MRKKYNKNWRVIIVYENEIQMHGYINIKSLNRRFHYKFFDNTITVYSRDSLPLEQDDIDITIECDTKYVYANDLSTGNNIIFFVDRIPFSNDQQLFLLR